MYLPYYVMWCDVRYVCLCMLPKFQQGPGCQIFFCIAQTLTVQHQWHQQKKHPWESVHQFCELFWEFWYPPDGPQRLHCQAPAPELLMRAVYLSRAGPRDQLWHHAAWVLWRFVSPYLYIYIYTLLWWSPYIFGYILVYVLHQTIPTRTVYNPTRIQVGFSKDLCLCTSFWSNPLRPQVSAQMAWANASLIAWTWHWRKWNTSGEPRWCLYHLWKGATCWSVEKMVQQKPHLLPTLDPTVFCVTNFLGLKKPNGSDFTGVAEAMLDPRVAKFGPTVTSRVFLHFLSEMDCTPLGPTIYGDNVVKKKGDLELLGVEVQFCMNKCSFECC